MRKIALSSFFPSRDVIPKIALPTGSKRTFPVWAFASLNGETVAAKYLKSPDLISLYMSSGRSWFAR